MENLEDVESHQNPDERLVCRHLFSPVDFYEFSLFL